jgi:hypothetical protein
MNTITSKHFAAALGTALVLTGALAATPASATVDNPVTTTTTSTTTPSTVVNRVYNTKIGSVYVEKNTRSMVLENQWCRSWGEGQYRIRDFKLNNVLAPEDRNTPVPEGSFGFPTRQVVQARAVYCGRNAEGLVEYPVSAAGLRIDAEVPRYSGGRPVGFIRTVRGVVRNWSDNASIFEGEVPSMMKGLPVGSYTMSAVSTQFLADNATLTYTVVPGPR